MVDEPQVVRQVSWGEVLGLGPIFRSFKMAIHPGKLLLALLALGLVAGLGMGMDRLYSAMNKNHRVMPGETWQYWSLSKVSFAEARENWLKNRRDKDLNAGKDDIGAAVTTLRRNNQESLENSLRAVDQGLDEIRKNTNLTEKEQTEQIAKARASRQQSALGEFYREKNRIDRAYGMGVFEAFCDWESNCLRNALVSVQHLSFFGGFQDALARRATITPAAYAIPSADNRPDPNAAVEERGLLVWLMLVVWGLVWMVNAYPWYAVVFLLVSLAIWSIFGGAVCRIAALHAARDEKIGVLSSLRFSAGKFFNFLMAPLLPLIIIVALGMVLALGGLVGALPFGEWLVGLLFIFALIIGAVMAFLVLGLASGAPLMWPTIATEGSDSFDAISRSFSYVFARPFRYGWYWIVASVYGAISYLFVRLFAWVSLLCVHAWMAWPMRLASQEGYAAGAGKLDLMWDHPAFLEFHGPMHTEAANWSTAGASYLVAFWVCLVSGVVTAFLASFLLSAATNIYLLMRQKVDATDLDDVYVDEPDAMGPASAPSVAPQSEVPAAKPAGPPPPPPAPPAGVGNP